MPVVAGWEVVVDVWVVSIVVRSPDTYEHAELVPSHLARNPCDFVKYAFESLLPVRLTPELARVLRV